MAEDQAVRKIAAAVAEAARNGTRFNGERRRGTASIHHDTDVRYPRRWATAEGMLTERLRELEADGGRGSGA